MTNEYVAKEVEKIIKDENLPFPLNIAMSASWILGNLKGINLKILDVKKTSHLSDYYVLSSATNFTQMRSMAEEILFQLKKHGFEAISKEGLNESDWILLDLGDIIVHIFLETARDSYDLESLWKEAVSVSIPQSYYFSEQSPLENQNPNKDESYF